MENQQSNLRIFKWAMLHSPEFRYCFIKLPISLGFKWAKDYKGDWSVSISISFQRLGVYIPWSVRDDHYLHTGRDNPALDFDDIPF